MPPLNVSSQQQARVLLVEGQNDKHVVIHLVNRRFSGDNETAPEFYIKDMEGVQPLLDVIGAEIIAPQREAVGILVDADDDVNARWEAVRNRLLEEGVSAPPRPNPNGTVIHTAGKPRVGVWIMPDNETGGELEGFVERMIPANDRVWPLSQEYIDGIPPEHQEFSKNKALRAKIHAWLAAREDPRQMGLAIGAEDLDIDGPLCRRFVAWLEELFG